MTSREAVKNTVMTERYNAFGRHMRELFGQPVFKISVDAGFTCPNRDGTIAFGGCTYCNNDSFRPQACVDTEPVTVQIKRSTPYLRSRYGAEKFIVYFQPHTNTHAKPRVLEKVYREALDNEGVVGLAIGTRPDCVDEKKIALLETLARDYFILIEYGLQSIYDKTLAFINRGHTYSRFMRALDITANRGIRIGAHIILGFPTETREQMLAMAGELSHLRVEFLKIHQLQVVRHTVLAQVFKNKPFPTFGYYDWIEMLTDFLERLSPQIVLQRLFATAPSDILIAPIWGKRRYQLIRDLDAYMERRNSFQGKKWQDEGCHKSAEH